MGVSVAMVRIVLVLVSVCSGVFSRTDIFFPCAHHYLHSSLHDSRKKGDETWRTFRKTSRAVACTRSSGGSSSPLSDSARAQVSSRSTRIRSGKRANRSRTDSSENLLPSFTLLLLFCP